MRKISKITRVTSIMAGNRGNVKNYGTKNIVNKIECDIHYNLWGAGLYLSISDLLLSKEGIKLSRNGNSVC